MLLNPKAQSTESHPRSDSGRPDKQDWWVTPINAQYTRIIASSKQLAKDLFLVYDSK